MIICKICNASFNNVISWKHLKKHNITTEEYKKLHGEVVSEEYRQQRSENTTGKNNSNFGKKWSPEKKEALGEKLKGRPAWNKGKPLNEHTKQLLSEKAKTRVPVYGRNHSDETKEKIKIARAKQIITPESVQKALATKIKNGHDLAFFRGKKHSEESLIKIKETIQRNATAKKEKSIQKIFENLNLANVKLINDPNEWIYDLQCNECGKQFTFTKQYLIGKKFKTTICPSCFPREIISSQAEKEIVDWLETFGINVATNVRNIITPLELDIYLPEHNIAIEYNGLYWHSDLNGKDSTYHLNKTTTCASKGINLITIFEDEWLNHPNIVKSRLKNLLNKTSNKLHARKCEIRQITSKLANEFLNENHIQGAGRSNIRYGAFYQNILVSVMTFSKSNISRKNTHWEIDRFCSLLYTSITGIASKIFKQFIKDYDPNIVISFADKRWTNSGFYTNLGFQVEKETTPNYWYFKSNIPKRYHRYSLRKNKNDDPNLTEWENRQLQGWDRIWDCGNIKYVWRKN